MNTANVHPFIANWTPITSYEEGMSRFPLHAALNFLRKRGPCRHAEDSSKDMRRASQNQRHNVIHWGTDPCAVCTRS
jgi:hypothetical protein